MATIAKYRTNQSSYVSRQGSQVFNLGLIALVILLLSACSLTPSKPSAERIDADTANVANAPKVVDPISLQDYQQAITFIENSQYADANRLLIKVIDKHPNLAAPLYNLGVIAETQKDLETAIGYYSRAIETDKNYYLAYNNLGIIARTKGDFEQAFSYYNSGLKIAPDNTELNYNMAVLNEIYLHDYRKAIEYYERYLASFDENSSVEPDKNVTSWIKDLKRRSR